MTTLAPGPKPYVCVECGKVFPYWKFNMLTHVRLDRDGYVCGPVILLEKVTGGHDRRC